MSIKDEIDIDLRRKVLERDMTASLDVTSASEIVGILNEVYDESIDSADINPIATDDDDESSFLFRSLSAFPLT